MRYSLPGPYEASNYIMLVGGSYKNLQGSARKGKTVQNPVAVTPSTKPLRRAPALPIQRHVMRKLGPRKGPAKTGRRRKSKPRLVRQKEKSATVQRRNERYSKKFDSTLGYPGEGPDLTPCNFKFSHSVVRHYHKKRPTGAQRRLDEKKAKSGSPKPPPKMCDKKHCVDPDHLHDVLQIAELIRLSPVNHLHPLSGVAKESKYSSCCDDVAVDPDCLDFMSPDPPPRKPSVLSPPLPTVPAVAANPVTFHMSVGARPLAAYLTRTPPQPPAIAKASGSTAAKFSSTPHPSGVPPRPNGGTPRARLFYTSDPAGEEGRGRSRGGGGP